uniref:Uncharacterized protein n=1 Tax=Arundo donax TaxID=35708 RepID=A0A0A8ZCD0_ARUDO
MIGETSQPAIEIPHPTEVMLTRSIGS